MQSICQRCVLDNSVSEIVVDKAGVCNFCKDFDEQISDYVLSEEQVNLLLTKLLF